MLARKALLALGLACLLVPLAAVPGAAHHSANTIYFSGIREADWTTGTGCPEMPAYALTHEPTAGRAYAAPSYAVSSCPTRFNYPATEDFALDPGVSIRFWVACDAPVASAGAAIANFDLLLTQEDDPSNDHPDWQPVFQGELLCTSTPMEIAVTLEHLDLLVRAGETLYLHILAFYENPPSSAVPNLHYVTGPDYPSGITAKGLPDHQASATVVTLAHLYLSQELAETVSNADCGRTPVFNLTTARPAAGAINAEEGLGVQTCPVVFAYQVAEAFSLTGRTELRFWYRCPQETDLAGFVADIYQNDNRIAGREAYLIPEDRACTPMPAEQAITISIPTTKFEPSDTLGLRLGAVAVNPAPDQFPLVEYLVGGEMASRLEAGFPWGAGGSAPLREEKSSPTPVLLAVLAIGLSMLPRKRGGCLGSEYACRR